MSKAEGRYVDLATVTPSPRAEALGAETDKDPRLVELILEELRRVVRHRPGVLIVEHRLGFVMANAGIDRSNVDPGSGAEPVLLLPRDPEASAAEPCARRLGAHLGAAPAVIISRQFRPRLAPRHGRHRAGRRGSAGDASICAAVPIFTAARCA